ncbi:MAG: LCP family protein [Gaiella sp.]
MKRGVGFETHANGNGTGNGTGVVPPGPIEPFVLYKQPEPPVRSRKRLALLVLGWMFWVLTMCAAGVGGGAYLYLHQTAADIAPESADTVKATKTLDVALPGQPANALVIGYDRRKDDEKGVPARSDTLMLVRADPSGKTISMLSFPRDLRVEVVCPEGPRFVGKINGAYAECGAQGALETVRSLTGVPINYLITVNFRGFREMVDAFGGVWMDVDRRYFNANGGTCSTCYAKINLQPGYQRLSGYRALDFVRYRHTDSDLYRNARQQLFVRAFRDQVKANSGPRDLLKVVKVITKNVEVGQGGGKNVSASTLLSYAALAYDLPRGHVFQSRIQGIEGFSDLSASTENIRKAVAEFTHPDVDAPRKATQVALNEKPKVRAPLPSATTLTVLNGNGVAGSASNASYLLGQRGYQMLFPPGGRPANAPTYDFFRTAVYFDAAQPGAKQAGQRVVGLFGAADLRKMTPAISDLGNGAMLVAVVGQTFKNRLAAAPIDQTPTKREADVVPGTDSAYQLLRDRGGRLGFPMMVPTVVADGSWIDTERPIRLYRIDPAGKHKAIRLTYKLSGRPEYYGIQMTDWDDAPVLGSRSFVRNLGGRRYELFYDGPRLHMVALRTPKGTYWVVNTLLDQLSNETMLAIAKGLRPLGKIKR